VFDTTEKQQAIHEYLRKNPSDAANLTAREITQRINDSSDVKVGSTLVYVVQKAFLGDVGDAGDADDISRVIEVLLACVSDDDINFAMDWTGYSETHPLCDAKTIRAEIFKRHSR